LLKKGKAGQKENAQKKGSRNEGKVRDDPSSEAVKKKKGD